MSTLPNIFSMTGFGRSAGSFGKFSWNWETKSVNGKGLDIKCRLPHGLEDLDLKARKIAGQKFSRGNINLTLSIKENGNQPNYRINRELLDELIKTAREVFRGYDYQFHICVSTTCPDIKKHSPCLIHSSFRT